MTENKNEIQEFYKNEGMAIIVKGQMVIGIHPDNLENNLNALSNGDMKFDWKMFQTLIKK